MLEFIKKIPVDRVIITNTSMSLISSGINGIKNIPSRGIISLSELGFTSPEAFIEYVTKTKPGFATLIGRGTLEVSVAEETVIPKILKVESLEYFHIKGTTESVLESEEGDSLVSEVVDVVVSGDEEIETKPTVSPPKKKKKN